MDNNAKEVSLPTTATVGFNLTVTNDLRRRSPRSVTAALVRLTSNNPARSEKTLNNYARS